MMPFILRYFCENYEAIYHMTLGKIVQFYNFIAVQSVPSYMSWSNSMGL